MKPNARQLAMRDPALAAFLGIEIGADGADFGVDDTFGNATYPGVNDYGFDPNVGAEFGADFNGDFGADIMPMAAGVTGLAPMAPTPANMQAAWGHFQQSRAKAAHSAKRAAILEPNKGSDVQIERYFFSVNQTLTLGTAVAISANNNPDTKMRPQRVTANAPAPGFITIDELKVSNVSVSIGGTCDAYDFNALGVGQTLDMPTLTPSNKASVLGNYTGFVPPGYVNAATYKFCLSFKGPSVVAGG